MMRTYDEAFAAARDKPAFSNGTEGYAWMDNWCGECAHDRGARDGSDPPGCPLVMVAMMQRTPIEWLEQDRFRLGDQYHCTEFAPDDDGGGDDPPPEPPRWDPEMPGQITIFEVFTDEFVERMEHVAREPVEVLEVTP